MDTSLASPSDNNTSFPSGKSGTLAEGKLTNIFQVLEEIGDSLSFAIGEDIFV